MREIIKNKRLVYFAVKALENTSIVKESEKTICQIL